MDFKITKWGRELTKEDYIESYLTIIAIEIRKHFLKTHSMRVEHRSAFATQLVYMLEESLRDCSIFDRFMVMSDDRVLQEERGRFALHSLDPYLLYIKFRPKDHYEEVGIKFIASIDIEESTLSIDRVDDQDVLLKWYNPEMSKVNGVHCYDRS